MARLQNAVGCSSPTDVAVWTEGRPDEAVAIEVKRVKAIEWADGYGTISKLHELREGMRQSALHAKLGFWRVHSLADAYN
jgi:hypothetical protein